MSSLTDDFDVVLQLKDEAIGRALREMHGAGALEHHFVDAHAGARVELSVDAPRLTLDTAPSADGRARAFVQTRARVFTRDLADPADPGVTATADTTVRVALRMSVGAPGAPVRFGVDPGETTRADVAVHGVAGSTARDVEDALLGFVAGHLGGVITTPALGDGSRRAVGLGLRFLAAPSGRPVAALGISFEGSPVGNAAGLTQAVVRQDWALALSQRYVLDRIYEALLAELGALPPPRGGAPVVLSRQEVCVIPSPFGCIYSAPQRVLLERLEATLLPGSIVISGAVRSQVDTWMVPDMTAVFSMVATLSIDHDGRLAVTVGDVSTELQEWYAVLLDFLSGDKLEAAIRQGVYAALQGNAQGELSSLFSAGLLGAVASLGRLASVTLTPKPAIVEVRADAVVVHGTLSTPAPSQAPRASIEAFRVPGAPMRRRFHAGDSWAPGAGIASYTWAFGDGQSLTCAGDDARFVAVHDYAPGRYTASVTVVDDRGCSATAAVALRPAALTLQRVAADGSVAGWMLSWKAGALTAVFRVVDEDGAVPGATVTVLAHTWSQQGTTGADGSASFALDPARFNDDPPPGAGPSGCFVHTWVLVTAARPGYAGDSGMLYTGGQLPDTNGWAALRRRLLDWLDWPVSSARLGDDRMDPSIREEMKDVSLTLDALGSVLDLAERASSVLPIQALCGIERSASPEAIVERLARVMNLAEGRLEAERARIERGVRATETRAPRPLLEPSKLAALVAAAKLKRVVPRDPGIDAGAAAVSEDMRLATVTLGKLGLVAQRGTRFLPLAALLGAASDAAVGDRLSAVASSMRGTLDAAEKTLAALPHR